MKLFKSKLIISALFILGLYSNSFSQTPIPVSTMTVPSEGFVGEPFSFTHTLTNTNDPGYNPYVRLFIPDGITFTSASLPTGTQTSTLVPGVGIIKDIKLNTGTVADSVTVPVGYTLYIIDFTVGSMVTGGPALTVTINAAIDASATLGVPLCIRAQPVYELGDAPTGVNGPIFGTVLPQSIIPILFRIDKTGRTQIVPGGGVDSCHVFTYTIIYFFLFVLFNQKS